MKISVDTKKIRALLERLDLDQTQVAEQAALSKSGVSSVLTSGRCTLETAKKLAGALGIDVEEIRLRTFTDTEEATSDASLQPRPADRPPVTGIPQPILDFLTTLNAEEHQELLDIGPKIHAIYRARRSGDETAAHAYDVFKDILNRYYQSVAVAVPVVTLPAKKRRGGLTPTWSES